MRREFSARTGCIATRSFNGKSGGHNIDESNDGRAAAAKEYIEKLGSRWVQVDAHTEHELNDD